MGTPALNLPHRTDNKLYRLQTGQTPVVRPRLHGDYGVDSYPNGMNAVVAVISYTGYDMEDASIINKSSHERGYGYGTVYKSEFVDLGADQKRRGGSSGPITTFFGVVSANGEGLGMKRLQEISPFIDLDGLPHVGIKLTNGDPLYAVVDDETGKVRVVNYKSMEDAFIDEVRVIGISASCKVNHRLQVRILGMNRFRKSTSNIALSDRRLWETNFHPDTAKRVSFPKSGPLWICRLQRLE